MLPDDDTDLFFHEAPQLPAGYYSDTDEQEAFPMTQGTIEAVNLLTGFSKVSFFFFSCCRNHH